MSTQVQIVGPQFSTMVRSVQLCCEEKGIDYTLGLELDGNAIAFKGDQHFTLHPFGKIPVLVHGEQHLFETAPICRYLDSSFSGAALQPDDPYQRAQVDQWCQAITCYFDPILVRKYLLEFAFPKGEKGAIRMDKVAEKQPEVIKALAQLEDVLGDTAFFCSDQYSLADALLTPILDYLKTLPHADSLMAPDSKLTAYVERMRTRESGQKVLIAKK